VADATDTTTAGALHEAETRFEKGAIDAPRVQAMALLAHALDTNHAGVLARLGDPLADHDAKVFARLVARRIAHEPLQYILGHAHFLDFSVRVGPGVFIPRPETEQLVETALEAWDPHHRWAIDLCCGSGAIAVALARARPRARILAIDRAPAPRRMALQNARDHRVDGRVAVCGGDLLTAVATASGATEDLGAIVCNPPYAASGEVVQPEVLEHEPARAWEAGPVGTEVYARVIPQAAELLRPGRPLLLELGYGQAPAVRDLFTNDGRWERVTIDDDFQGIPRVLTARRR